jgi:hypothetical protein
MDGIELLRQVANRRITAPGDRGHRARGSPSDETRALSGGAIEFFEKPIQAEPFVRCVQGLLEANEHRSRIEGVSIAGFVQLLNMERKTCALRVTTSETQGVLFFSSGVLVDARQDERSRRRGGARDLHVEGGGDHPGRAVPRPQRDDPRQRHRAAARVGAPRRRARAQRAAQRGPGRQQRTSRGGRGRREQGAGAQPGALAREPAPAEPGRAGPGAAAAARARPEPSFQMSPELAATVSRAITSDPPERPLERPQPEASAAAPLAPWEGPEALVKIGRALAEAVKLDGAIGAALANWELDQCLGSQGGSDGLRLDVAVSGNCRVMRALTTCMARVGQRSSMQDVVITLDAQLHILTPLAAHDRLFLYIALDRSRGNLALARHRLARIVAELVF